LIVKGIHLRRAVDIAFNQGAGDMNFTRREIRGKEQRGAALGTKTPPALF
jgi:hypothetical protein